MELPSADELRRQAEAVRAREAEAQTRVGTAFEEAQSLMSQVRTRAIEMGIQPTRFSAFDCGPRHSVHLNGWRIWGGENTNFAFWLVVTTQEQVFQMYTPSTEVGWDNMEGDASAMIWQFKPEDLGRPITLENLRANAVDFLRSAPSTGQGIDVSSIPGVELPAPKSAPPVTVVARTGGCALVVLAALVCVGVNVAAFITLT